MILLFEVAIIIIIKYLFLIAYNTLNPWVVVGFRLQMNLSSSFPSLARTCPTHFIYLSSQCYFCYLSNHMQITCLLSHMICVVCMYLILNTIHLAFRLLPRDYAPFLMPFFFLPLFILCYLLRIICSLCHIACPTKVFRVTTLCLKKKKIG